MFCYLSHIIELGLMDEIHLLFLIVGHTHNPLDQWFSVLGGAIYDAEFFGSRMALHNLYTSAHHNEQAQASHVNIQLTVIHDYVKLYDPWINDDIHYYGIPQRYKIWRFGGIAITQYMILSPAVQWLEGKSWLPRIPHSFVSSEESMLNAQTDIAVQQFTSIGGEAAMLKAHNIHVSDGSKITGDSLKATALLYKARNFSESLPDLLDVEAAAISEQILRFEKESLDGVHEDRLYPDDDLLTTVTQDMLVSLNRI